MTTAYLARIRLNTRSDAVRRDLADVVALHRTVMRMLPDGLGDEPRRDAGALFRLDETTDDVSVLVQARLPLDPSRLPLGYGDTEVRDLGPMFKVLATDMRVRYRIAANASKTLRPTEEEKAKGRTRGKVKALTGDDAVAWWERRATAVGLTLLSVIPSPARTARGRGSTAPLHALARFDGFATVTDAQALHDALLNGIGKGKAYGAGLLSLAPVGRE